MPATAARLVLRRPRIAAPGSRQKGAVLLASLLLLVIAASFVLVRKLNVAATSYYRDQQTAYVLSQAKQALIGYAAAHPEVRANNPSPTVGPGRLPCPDLNNNGISSIPDDGGSCAVAAAVPSTSLRRLPWRTLDLPDLRDSSGERLWYAVADNFRANPLVPPVLNSDTRGQFTVNGTADVVAVVFAPGPPLSSNDDRIAGPEVSANFLEGDNATITDFTFTSRGTVDLNGDGQINDQDLNDQVAVITRAELMAVVEKRILGEVAQTLAIYRNNYAANAYPWLSPFDNPFLSTFDGAVDTWEGHLPIHIDNEQFPTAFSASWAVTGGTTTSSGLPPDENCVRSATCFDAVYGPITGPLVGSTCTWTNGNPPPPPTYGKDALNCSAILNLGGGVTRRYQFLYTSVGVAATIVAPPNGSATRTREFHLASPFPPQVAVITVIDRDSIGTEIGRRTLDVDGTSTGNIDITGIQYDLDTNTYATVPAGPEIPPWFVANNWHHLIYAAYPTVEDPPGSAAVCVPGTDCLTLNGVGTPINNKRALVISAGSDLDVITPRPNNVLAEYLEGENSSPTGNGVFARQQPLNGAFNDQVRVVRTSP